MDGGILNTNTSMPLGGKTGYTHVAQNTLVTYGEKNGMELVCVIMKAAGPKQGEPNEYTDTTKLLNYGFEKYQKYTVNQENEQINADLFNNYGSYFNADESPVRLADGACVVLPKGIPLSAAKQSITYNKNVKLHDGDNVIGQITYTYGNKTVGASNIIYTNSDSTKHLDEASRNLVNAKIANMEANNSQAKNTKKTVPQYCRCCESVVPQGRKRFTQSTFRKCDHYHHRIVVDHHYRGPVAQPDTKPQTPRTQTKRWLSKSWRSTSSCEAEKKPQPRRFCSKFRTSKSQQAL